MRLTEWRESITLAFFTALGITSGADTYAGLYDRKDLSLQKRWFSQHLLVLLRPLLVKCSLTWTRLLVSGAARTVRAKTTQEFAKMAKDRLSEITRARGIRQGLKQTGKGLSEEFLEEFGVEVVAQG